MTSVINNVPTSEAPACRFHQLSIGDKALQITHTRDVLNLFRDLTGGGIFAADFPRYLQDLSKKLFNDPKAINVGAPLKYRRPDGNLVLAAFVGSGVSLPAAHV